MPNRNYLLVIDQEPINKELEDYFAQYSLRIDQQTTLNPISFLSKLPHAILIHWSFIKKNLHEIQRLFTTYPIPIIIINEQTDEDICITVLDAGADDFLVKPLNPRELHARISAISRRVLQGGEQFYSCKEVFRFANWHLNPASRQLFDSNDKEQLLSAGEYELLLIFVQQPQQVLDRELLLQLTKSSELHPFDRRIDVQISRLRQKIEVDAKKPLLIKTVRNGGYMFTPKVFSMLEQET